MRNTGDLIASIATPAGEGGIAVIRVSGSGALNILKSAFKGKTAFSEPGRMYYGHVIDASGGEIDEAMAVYFKAPRSYTREDVIELHCHGGRYVSGRVLQRCVELGCRPAERGEFTYRAFANGRIDLAGAEAVMQLIGAGGEKAARCALRQLRGGVSSRMGRCREKLKNLMSLIDAAADFPDEIDEEVSAARVRGEAGALKDELERACDPRYAHIVSDGARVVIAGKPNVGKSSVMNALLGADRAIVSDIAGTTRDVISEKVSFEGLTLTITDTAGIRETRDDIERQGVSRARAALQEADCVVLVLDASRALDAEDEELLQNRDGRYIVALNKSDAARFRVKCDVEVSARDGSGIAELLRLIKQKCDPGEDDEKLMSLRHIACAGRAIRALENIAGAPAGAHLDLMREDVREALQALGEITGEDVKAQAIDGIFERFCVGK